VGDPDADLASRWCFKCSAIALIEAQQSAAAIGIGHHYTSTGVRTSAVGELLHDLVTHSTGAAVRAIDYWSIAIGAH
jgi:hypothetical protein